MFAGVTIYEQYRKILEEIRKRYDPSEADMITSMLFESICGMNRSLVARNGTKELGNNEETQIRNACTRILSGEPVQYVIGKCWFYGQYFIVRPGVLIPRPETEELVKALIDSAGDGKLEILDIGTGSGCIAISIRRALPLSHVTAIDISEEALLTARENASRLARDVEFKQLDFLQEDDWKQLGIFNRIISNPPYIPLQEKNSLEEHVREHEPAIALFVPDEDPLIYYKKIAAFSIEHLAKNGSIFLEIHEPYAESICNILKDQGFVPEIMKDIFGKKRMIRANHCR